MNRKYITKRVARKVLANRPIPIDKKKVGEVEKRLFKSFEFHIKYMQEGVTVSEEFKNREIARAGLRVTDVAGRKWRVVVVLVPKPSRSYEVFVGGRLRSSKEEDFMGNVISEKRDRIEIYVNGHMTKEDIAYKISKGHLRGRLLRILLHEITHAAEFKLPSPDHYVKGDKNYADYINQPVEIRAKMQEILHDFDNLPMSFFRVMGMDSKKEVIEYVLNDSKAWNKVKKLLTRKNKQLILKAIYRQVDEMWDEEEED